jgi:hypothetical protein
VTRQLALLFVVALNIDGVEGSNPNFEKLQPHQHTVLLFPHGAICCGFEPCGTAAQARWNSRDLGVESRLLCLKFNQQLSSDVFVLSWCVV